LHRLYSRKPLPVAAEDVARVFAALQSPLTPIEPTVCRYIAGSKDGLLLLKRDLKIARDGLKQWLESLQRAQKPNRGF